MTVKMPHQLETSAVQFKGAQRCVVLLNPNSGSVRDGDEVTAVVREHLPEAEIIVSKEHGDLEEGAARAQADGCNAVIAAGGDGTLNEVLNGCMRAGGQITLGLIPLGTGNDFARAIGLPTDITEALGVIQRGHAAPIDVIRVTGERTRYMINVAAGGFAGLVSESLTPELKASWGPLSYLRGMIDALGEMKPYEASYQIDGAAPQRIRTLNIAVANGSHVARGIPIAPDANPADGLMDIVFLEDTSLPALALLTPEILAGTHLNNSEILYMRARHFSLQSTPPMTFNADGEVIGEGAFEFVILPEAISFLVPPQVAQS
jgi:diacylglycerol kinase (ATP)